MGGIIYTLVLTEVVTKTSAAFQSVDTGGRYCNHPRTELFVTPGDQQSCKAECEGLGRSYCMYDYGTNDGYCMASDLCSSLLLPGDSRRYNVWVFVLEPVFTWTAPNDTFTFTGQQCLARDEGMAADLPLGGQSYTIEAWVKPAADGQPRGFVYWGTHEISNKVQAFRMGDHDGKQGAGAVVDYWWDNDFEAILPYNMADGAWHHIASTWDGTTSRIYLDFTLVAEKLRSNRLVDTKSNFCVGTGWDIADKEYFKGSMCVLRIWKVARSAEEMEQGAACTSTTTSTTVTTATATMTISTMTISTTTTRTTTTRILHSIVNRHFRLNFIPNASKLGLNATCPRTGVWWINNIAPQVVTVEAYMGDSHGWLSLGHVGHGVVIRKYGGPSFTWRLVSVANETFTVQNSVVDNSGNSYLAIHPNRRHAQLEPSAEEERAQWLIRSFP